MPPLYEVGAEMSKFSTELLKTPVIPVGMGATAGRVRDIFLECREPALVVKYPLSSQQSKVNPCSHIPGLTSMPVCNGFFPRHVKAGVRREQ